MAQVGLNNFRYSKLTEAQDGTASYDGAKKPAKAVSFSTSITNNDAKLFADDGLAESDTSFQSGTCTMGIDRFDNATQADLLGHTLGEDGELVKNVNDVAPYVAVGRVVTLMEDGAYKYRVEFLHKVKFAEPSQDNETKGENVSFSTISIEGTISSLANGDWNKTKTFDTKAEAITYLEGLMAKS